MSLSSQNAGGLEYVATEEELLSVLEKAAKSQHPAGLDTETLGIDPRKQSPVGNGQIHCWSLAYVDGTLGFHRQKVPLARRVFVAPGLLQCAKPWLESDSPKVGHNIFGFDRHMFANHGIRLGGVVADTKYTARLLWPDRLVSCALKDLMWKQLGYKLGELKDLFPGKRRQMLPLDQVWATEANRPILADYASLDAKATLEIYLLVHNKLKPDQRQIYQNLIHPCLLALNDMELRGVFLDPGICAAGYEAAMVHAKEAEDVLKEWAGEVNWNSPKQVANLIYTQKKFGVPAQVGSLKALKPNRSEKLSTDEGALHWHAGKLTNPADKAGIDALIKLKKVRKYAIFMRDLPKHCGHDGRIHAGFSPDTETGRLSCKRPNLQQIPATDPYGMRKAFRPEPGYSFLVCDYAQLEMYILAHFLIVHFDDHALANDLLAGDVHTGTARRCWPGFPESELKHYRSLAKTINFATNYGKGVAGLGYQIRDTDNRPIGTKAAKELLDAYFAGYQAIPRFHALMRRLAHQHKGVGTLLGRWRPLKTINALRKPGQTKDESKESRRLEASDERRALNTPIQGSAADVVSLAMIACHNDAELNALGAKMVLQVHDELVFEVPKRNSDIALKRAVYLMENPVKLNVQLRVDGKVCQDWSEK